MSSDKYSSRYYNDYQRWTSYWNQINEVLNLKPKRVLEIGPGNMVVADQLRGFGLNVVTLDYDVNLKPTVNGNFLKLPFKDNSFDVVLCAQVLEHLPFAKFEKAIKEIGRVAEKAVVSLPHPGPTVRFTLKLPLLKRIDWMGKASLPLSHRFNGRHYWEVGKRGSSFNSVKRIMEKFFIIKKTFIHPENTWHRFFVLEKK